MRSGIYVDSMGRSLVVRVFAIDDDTVAHRVSFHSPSILPMRASALPSRRDSLSGGALIMVLPEDVVVEVDLHPQFQTPLVGSLHPEEEVLIVVLIVPPVVDRCFHRLVH